jgi:hypothetical protein
VKLIGNSGIYLYVNLRLFAEGFFGSELSQLRSIPSADIYCPHLLLAPD